MGTLYRDVRLGGPAGPLVLGDPRDLLMRIPDKALRCVVFICSRGQKGALEYRGTGFLAGVKSATGGWFVYLVTAKHVVAGTRPGDLLLRLNTRDGGVETVVIDDTWELSRDADVAVQGVNIPMDRFEHSPVDWDTALTPKLRIAHAIGIGDDIAAVGLFAERAGRERNRPIARFGHIAAMPDEPVKDDLGGEYPAYLVEMRSTSGFSGSPVFCFLDPGRVHPDDPNTFQFARNGFLLGMARGHWNLVGSGRKLRFGKRELLALNSGVGLVTPIEDVTKVLMCEEAVMARKKYEEEESNRNLPVADSNRKREAPDVLTAKAFDDALKRASRKISPRDRGKKGT